MGGCRSGMVARRPAPGRPAAERICKCSGAQLRCPTPAKPEPATHDLLVSLNSFDYDPTYFKFTFYSLEPALSRRVQLAMRVSLDEIPHGSPSQAAFSEAVAADLAGAVSATLGAQVAAEQHVCIGMRTETKGGAGKSATPPT